MRTLGVNQVTKNNQPMIHRDTLQQIAQTAHRFAKGHYGKRQPYAEALKIGFRRAWRELYTVTTDVIVNGIEELYKLLKQHTEKDYRLRRDLRTKGNNACITILKNNRIMNIKFAATGILKDLVAAYKPNSTYAWDCVLYPVSCLVMDIAEKDGTIERRLMLDELLADLAN